MATRKTPKKEADEAPKPSTPLRSNIVRAASMQSRLRTPRKTPTAEDKKLEREKRKTEEALLKPKRAATPRRPKTEKDKDKDPASEEEQSGDTEEKHVKWEDEESSSGAEEIIEMKRNQRGDDKAEEMEVEPEDGSKVQLHDANFITPQPTPKHNSNKNIIDTPIADEEDDYVVAYVPLLKKEAKVEKESVVAAVEKPAAPKEELVEKEKGGETAVFSAKQELGEKEPESDEAKKREELILQKYNQQWQKENQRRERFSELEHDRRQRIAKRIEADFERSMAEEYGRRSSNKPHRSRSRAHDSSSPLLPATYANIKVEEIDSDSGDDESAIEYHEKIEQYKRILSEKDAIIQQLQQQHVDVARNEELRGEHVAQVLVELESNSEKRQLQAEILNLRERVALLEADLKNQVYTNGAVDELANQLELANKTNEENSSVVNSLSSALLHETEVMKQRHRQLEDKLTSDKARAEERLQFAQARLRELEDILKNKDKEFKAEVERAVRSKLQRMKERRRLQLEEQHAQPQSLSEKTPEANAEPEPIPAGSETGADSLDYSGPLAEEYLAGNPNDDATHPQNESPDMPGEGQELTNDDSREIAEEYQEGEPEEGQEQVDEEIEDTEHSTDSYSRKRKRSEPGDSVDSGDDINIQEEPAVRQRVSFASKVGKIAKPVVTGALSATIVAALYGSAQYAQHAF